MGCNLGHITRDLYGPDSMKVAIAGRPELDLINHIKDPGSFTVKSFFHRFGCFFLPMLFL